MPVPTMADTHASTAEAARALFAARYRARRASGPRAACIADRFAGMSGKPRQRRPPPAPSYERAEPERRKRLRSRASIMASIIPPAGAKRLWL